MNILPIGFEQNYQRNICFGTNNAHVIKLQNKLNIICAEAEKKGKILEFMETVLANKDTIKNNPNMLKECRGHLKLGKWVEEQVEWINPAQWIRVPGHYENTPDSTSNIRELIDIFKSELGIK